MSTSTNRNTYHWNAVLRLKKTRFDCLVYCTCTNGLDLCAFMLSYNSRTAAVAGAIAGVIREHKHAEVQAIGAGAVNQAIKALVLAKGYLAEDGIPVVCIPEFVDVDIDGKVRTAIKLVVEPR